MFKKNLKKAMSILLAAGMAASLAACGGGGEAAPTAAAGGWMELSQKPRQRRRWQRLPV